MLSDIKQLDEFQFGPYLFKKDVIVDQDYGGREHISWIFDLDKNTWFSIYFDERAGENLIYFSFNESHCRIGHFEATYKFDPKKVTIKILQDRFYRFLLKLLDWTQSERREMKSRAVRMDKLFFNVISTVPSSY